MSGPGAQAGLPPVRVAFVITRPERGGAQSHVLELLRGLPDPGAATLISGADADTFLLDAARALGASVRVLPELVVPIAPLRDLAALRALRRAFQELRPDLVHAHSSKAGLLARLAARSLGVPCVFTAHGWAFTEGAGPRRRALALVLERLGAWAAPEIIAVSDYDRTLGLRLGVGRPGSVTRIHNALPPGGPQRQAAWTGQGKLRVAMVARFAEPKQQAALIRAAAGVPEVQLVLLGDGPLLADAQALAASLGSDVLFLGSRPDVPEVLASCHAFALISRFEGFPISTLEAMRAGLALIVSDVGGAGEVFPAGGAHLASPGLRVPPGETGAVTAALRTLVSDPDRTRAMGDVAREVFLQRFTVRGMLAQTWEVYRRALARRGRAGPA